MTRPILILCEACGSEGRIYRGQYDDERDCGECPVCEGTGSVLIESEPVTLEDLEDVSTGVAAEQSTDEAGMSWWNGLTDAERSEWGKRVPTGRAVDCWEQHKRGGQMNAKIDDAALAEAIRKMRKLRLVDHVAIKDTAPPAVTFLETMKRGLGGMYDDAALEYVFRHFLKYYTSALTDAERG